MYERKSESEVAQSCPTLSDPMDRSPPGSSIHGIFQARVLEWGAIAFSWQYLLNQSLFLYHSLQRSLHTVQSKKSIPIMPFPCLTALFCRIKFKFLLLGSKTSMSSFCLYIFPKELSSPPYFPKNSSHTDYLNSLGCHIHLWGIVHVSHCVKFQNYIKLPSLIQRFCSDFDGSHLPIRTPAHLAPRASLLAAPDWVCRSSVFL